MSNHDSPPVEGYPKLACHMGRYTQSAIYRRFGSLNSQNILYMQAELVLLEEQLRGLEASDAASSEGHKSKYSKDWHWLSSYAPKEVSRQWEIALVIRQKLKEYNDAVIQQSIMVKLTDPDSHDLRSLQQWLERSSMGNRALTGEDRHTWGSSDEPLSPYSDLLTVFTSQGGDCFSAWFTARFLTSIHRVFWYRWKKADDLESGIASYDEKALHKFTSHVTTILASLLPILAIVVLYCVEPMKTRLGLVALFISLFSAGLSFFTNVKRSEIFVATSTFAAVQVVFIATGNEGGTFGG